MKKQSRAEEAEGNAGPSKASAWALRESATHVLSGELLKFLALVAAGFAIGAVTTTHSGMGTILHENWKLIFVSLSTLCLGFGFAALLHGRFRQAQANAIRQQYSALRGRADDLVKRLDAFERDKTARSS